MCYKLLAFMALLLMSIEIFAAGDMYISVLPNDSVKIEERKYKITKDFDTAIKRIKNAIGGKEYIKSDILVREEGFRIYVFYNNKQGAEWHKLFIVEEDGKIVARFF